MDSKFFTLIDPLFKYIDSGKFFRQPMQWLYYIIGVICLIAPLYLLYYLFDDNVFSYADGGECFAIILIWLVFAALCYGGFMLWFNRAGKLATILQPDSKFVAVPALANFIQTSGEFIGMFFGLFSFASSIIITLFSAGIARYAFGSLNAGSSLGTGIGMLLGGYIIVISSRYVAELVLAIADIANNTDKIAKSK